LEKERWILKSIAKQQSQAEKKESFVIDYGSSILFLGKPYPITNRNGTRAGFDDIEFYIPPGLSPEQIKATCIHLYKMLAKSHISQRVAFFASQYGCNANSSED